MNIQALPVHLKEMILHCIEDETWLLNPSYSRHVRCIMCRVCICAENIYTIDIRINQTRSLPYIMDTVEHILTNVLDMLSTCTKLKLHRTLREAAFICNKSRAVLNYFRFFYYLNETEMKQLINAHERLHDVLMNNKQHRHLCKKFTMDT